MHAQQDSQRTAVARDTTAATSHWLVRGVNAPSLARRHVQDEITAPFSAARLRDLTLLTSEVVTNAVEHSRGDAVELSVLAGPTLTRIAVGNPGQSWDRRPEPCPGDRNEPGGWGLFLVEQLSDRWGVSDSDQTVWFEFDHPVGAAP